MDELVAVSVTDGVATILLQRPPMNAINSEMRDGLVRAAQRITADPEVRAVVIYGGDRAFAAGADVKELAGMGHAEMARAAAGLTESVAAVARLPMPVIAAVTGYALGGGCELALAADFRVSADDAKWGQPEILLGIIPGMGGTQRLPRLVGVARAKDLIYSGRLVDAEQALHIGLVDTVVSAADVYSTAVRMARVYVNGPALALRAAKAAIDDGLNVGIDTGLRLESQLLAGLFATSDRSAGMRSFLERGPGRARFSGT